MLRPAALSVVETCTLPGIPDESTFVIDRDVTYTGAGGGQAFDMLRPTAAGPHPLAIFVHGGAWQSGDKSDYAYEMRFAADRGWAAASITRTIPRRR